ncbi:histone-fold-containing protein [Violaceomyces palustris]|uniref:Histone-fold-containing protein n=1 Tax=Violaceomyces palustris TaxID=1673888 RepID=A0ACD0NZ91_9BASI|nr:histone-fold-containing protein [Violaceomyces palustris]
MAKKSNPTTTAAVTDEVKAQRQEKSRSEDQQLKAQLQHSGGIGIDQFELPKASVAKIAKLEIPDNVQMRKEVISALVKSSTVFINYLASTSHDLAVGKGLKTITAANVLDSMRELDLPAEMRQELKVELEAFREIQKSRRKKSMTNTASSKPSSPAQQVDHQGSVPGEEEQEEQEEEGEEEPRLEETPSRKKKKVPATKGKGRYVEGEGEEEKVGEMGNGGKSSSSSKKKARISGYDESMDADVSRLTATDAGDEDDELEEEEGVGDVTDQTTKTIDDPSPRDGSPSEEMEED